MQKNSSPAADAQISSIIENNLAQSPRCSQNSCAPISEAVFAQGIQKLQELVHSKMEELGGYEQPVSIAARLLTESRELAESVCTRPVTADFLKAAIPPTLHFACLTNQFCVNVSRPQAHTVEADSRGQTRGSIQHERQCSLGQSLVEAARR